MARAGRKRKGRVARHRNGRAKQPTRTERAEEVMSVALGARAQHVGFSLTKAKDPHCATPYGILFMAGTITHKQLDAATAYQEAISRAYRLKGLTAPHIGSAALLSAGGAPLSEDPDDITVHEAWQIYHRIMDALMAAGKESGISKGMRDVNACKRIVHQCCFELDRDIHRHSLTEEELRNFRCGLNSIHKVLWCS